MASFVLKQTRIYYDAVDFGQYTNTVEIASASGEVDVTTFASDGWQEFLAGLKKGTFRIGGFWGFPNPDDVVHAAVASAPSDPAMTCTPTGVEGEPAYLFRPTSLQAAAGGSVGDAASQGLDGSVTGSVYRGGLGLERQTVTGATNGTPFQFAGGVPDGVDLAATLHVFTDNGSDVEVVLERAAASNMSGATTVHTFNASTTGGQWFRSSSIDNTQEWYRLRVVSVTGTSFEIAAAVGIA